jgi:transcriptional regulator with XRE-family HTH domain
MTSRDGPVARATRIAASDQARVLAEISRARRAAGLSDADTGRACGMSRSMVARIEAGTRRSSLKELAALGAVVGLDVRMRAYPAGDPIRDAGQQRLLDRLRRHLHSSIAMATEVPLPIDGDARAWDAMLRARTWNRPVEAETVIDDVQALERRLRMKARDGGVDGLILLVADTTRNRRALAAVPGSFQGFDRAARRVLRDLRDGRDPGRSSIVFL